MFEEETGEELVIIETDDTNEGEEAENSEAPVEDEEGEQEEVEGEEVAEGDEESERKPDHKKTAQDRIQQLANEKRELAERLAKLESKFETSQEEKPAWIPVNYEAVNKHIAETESHIEDLKLNGEMLEAKRAQKALDKLLDDIEANEAKKAIWEQKKAAKTTEQGALSAHLEKVDKAAEFFRTQAKIEKPVWDKMGTWFAEACQNDQTIGAEFAERAQQSPIAAVRWAHEYTTKNMGKDALASIEKKTNNKNRAAATAPQPSGKGAVIDLSKELAKATQLGTTEGWQKYMALKRQAGK